MGIIIDPLLRLINGVRHGDLLVRRVVSKACGLSLRVPDRLDSTGRIICKPSDVVLRWSGPPIRHLVPHHSIQRVKTLDLARAVGSIYLIDITRWIVMPYCGFLDGRAGSLSGAGFAVAGIVTVDGDFVTRIGNPCQITDVIVTQ